MILHNWRSDSKYFVLFSLLVIAYTIDVRICDLTKSSLCYFSHSILFPKKNKIRYIRAQFQLTVSEKRQKERKNVSNGNGEPRNDFFQWWLKRCNVRFVENFRNFFFQWFCGAVVLKNYHFLLCLVHISINPCRTSVHRAKTVFSTLLSIYFMVL